MKARATTQPADDRQSCDVQYKGSHSGAAYASGDLVTFETRPLVSFPDVELAMLTVGARLGLHAKLHCRLCTVPYAKRCKVRTSCSKRFHSCCWRRSALVPAPENLGAKPGEWAPPTHSNSLTVDIDYRVEGFLPFYSIIYAVDEARAAFICKPTPCEEAVARGHYVLVLV